MVAWGQEAQDMFGRVPESMEVSRPLQNGVIADYEVTENMLALPAAQDGRTALFPSAHHDHRSLWCDQRGKPRRA